MSGAFSRFAFLHVVLEMYTCKYMRHTRYSCLVPCNVFLIFRLVAQVTRFRNTFAVPHVLQGSTESRNTVRYRVATETVVIREEVSRIFAVPKSEIFATRLPVSSTFCGFMSPCSTFFGCECRYCNTKNRSRSSSASELR